MPICSESFLKQPLWPHLKSFRKFKILIEQIDLQFVIWCGLYQEDFAVKCPQDAITQNLKAKPKQQ